MSFSQTMKDAAERAARTFLQGFITVVTLDKVSSFDASSLQCLYAGLVAGALSLATYYAFPPKQADPSA